MKMAAMWQRRKTGQSAREPLYTLLEIADKLGMDYETLKKLMRNKHNKVAPPKAAMRPESATRMRQNLYKLSEFKSWMKELGESK